MNQFDVSFKDAIDELMLLNFRLYVLSQSLLTEKKRLEAINPLQPYLMASGFTFRDVTLMGTELNGFMPSQVYELTNTNVTNEFDVILSRQSLFHITQSYEILETYLYNQVTNLIQSSSIDLPSDFKPKDKSFNAIRAALKRIKGRNANNHLLTILRNNVEAFRAGEIDNIYEADLTKWYHLISMVRDCVTHRRMKVSEKLKNEFNDVHHTIFKTYTDADGEIILITDSEARELLSRVAEYIFLIYKSLTEQCHGIKVSFNSIQHIYKSINVEQS